MYGKTIQTSTLQGTIKVRYSLGPRSYCWQHKSEQKLSGLEDPQPQPEAHRPPKVREEGGQVEGQEVRPGHLYLVGELQLDR